jgi:hypothetical protein
MHVRRRRLRVVRTTLLAAGIFLAAMYATSWRGLWWISPRCSSVGVFKGGFVVQYWGQAASASGLESGFRWGDLTGLDVRINPPPGARNDIWRSRMLFVLAFHGRTGPGPRLHQLIIEARLFWPAAVLVALGSGLMLIRTRARKGTCAQCGYSLAGLASDAPCPECGARPLSD